MDKYLDLKIDDGGLVMDDGQQPQHIANVPSIAQDIKHTIMESGLARKLLGNRSRAERSDVLTEIELLVEEDLRLQAGSIWITEHSPERYVLEAVTLEQARITLELTP
ncbi:DUF2590 family protein [Shewanella algae]|uniref:DUF2590 family protein n=1 Tax=Shewanella algae TaxID=38313 RepID=UPI0009E51388|nr:DUF2590 family protein [Shewanella algae]MBO2576159.1 DUF2590 family protein [Shewanella algae]MBO2604290.1 DUF2590 family protein [Shewanella algae]MBO2631112.1 DUF2590 family protein [Shewanella algae]MBO2637936.1 DUF2590 family protein [Shewanella algae]MBO2639352.1 DUF2590 family protein [Shewanella algae]